MQSEHHPQEQKKHGHGGPFLLCVHKRVAASGLTLRGRTRRPRVDFTDFKCGNVAANCNDLCYAWSCKTLLGRATKDSTFRQVDLLTWKWVFPTLEGAQTGQSETGSNQRFASLDHKNQQWVDSTHGWFNTESCFRKRIPPWWVTCLLSCGKTFNRHFRSFPKSFGFVSCVHLLKNLWSCLSWEGCTWKVNHNIWFCSLPDQMIPAAAARGCQHQHPNRNQ